MTSTKLTPFTWHPGRVLLATVGIGLATAAWLMSPPSPEPVDTATFRFSAGRALAVLDGLLPDDTPHPIGTSANARVRTAIIAELQRLGLDAEIQTRFVCASYRHYCGTVHNVIARVYASSPESAGAGEAIVLNAHYDSQPATPGAADALSGVASNLEIARILFGDDLKRDVILLFNDGEEAGLLGATAFVDHHAWASDVVGFVNLEARGSGGISTPVYTIGADRTVLGPYARGLGRRAPGSAIGALSALLPAANDISVFDRLGVPGVTLGFASNVRHYHTPLDDRARLDPGSVQQQGDAALRITRALARADATPDAAAGRLTFVALGPTTLAWPETWTPALSYAAAGAFMLLLVALVRAGVATGAGLAWGLAAWPITVVIAFFGSAALNLLRRGLTESVAIWISWPEPTFFGFWAGAALLVGTMTWAFRRWAAPWGLWLGGWAWWAACGAVVATLYPGFGYLFVVPTLAAALAGLAALIMARGGARVSPAGTTIVLAAPALVALLVWLPQAWFLKDFIGLGNMPPVALAVAIGLTGSASLFADLARPGRVVAGLAGITLVLLGVGTRVPVFSADSPQWANVVYSLDVDSGEARWFYTGFPLPERVVEEGGFGEDYGRSLPWTPGDGGAVAAAPVADLPGPQIDVIETQGDIGVRARLYSPRGAPVIQLAFPAESAPTTVTFDGVAVPEDEARFPVFDDEFTVYTIWTVPESGVVAEFSFPSGVEPTLYLADRSYELPPVARALQAARPTSAVPIGGGDATVVWRRMSLRP